MISEITMEVFLKSVEKKAFRIIEIATGGADDTLDILQESMMAFVRRYSTKDESEWRPLFYKVVQNKIRDWFRKERIKRLFFFSMPPRQREETENRLDPEDSRPDHNAADPLTNIKTSQAMERLNMVLKQLPARQQQVFLLRAWEGLSTQETATAMNCTEGTVKTQYFRAVNRLKEGLEGTWP
jgi:RNA polymerase sigma-70 factor, ECF subfamily